MKRAILFLAAIAIFFTAIVPADAAVRVRGYYRKDGTYVQPHYRSNPDGNPYNNWSTYPNINPYTGEQGTKRIPPYPYNIVQTTPEVDSSLPERLDKSNNTVDAPIYPRLPRFSGLVAYPVVRVIDGDTIVINDGNEITVRLVGVDTPETVHPSKPVEYYGKEASRFTQNLLKGEKVYLVIDPQQGKTDRYGRTLAYIYRAPEGLFVNAEIIRQGYGHAYTQYPFEYIEEFRQLEQLARQAQKGLWSPEKTFKDTEPAKASPVLPSAVKSDSKTKPTETDVTVYITPTGAKYHRGTCRYLSKIKIPISLKEAKVRYSPCSVCNPPQ